MTELEWLWSNMHIEVHKRGYHNTHHLQDGGIQGFPARSDTVMHGAILDYLRMVLVRMQLFDPADSTFGQCSKTTPHLRTDGHESCQRLIATELHSGNPVALQGSTGISAWSSTQ